MIYIWPKMMGWLHLDKSDMSTLRSTDGAYVTFIVRSEKNLKWHIFTYYKFIMKFSRSYLAIASMVGMPWFLIIEPSCLLRLCGMAGDSSAECAAAGCGSCMNCMWLRWGGWLYPFARRGDFSNRAISETMRLLLIKSN